MRTGVVFVAIAAAAPVYAQNSAATGPPAAQAALKRARDAWNDGDFDVAPGLYQNALAAGGLSRADVIDALARTGSALAVVGKKKAALAAFRQAALLDPTFSVPPEAGRKAVALADRARKEQHKVGSLAVSARSPDEVSAGAPFAVEVTVAPAAQATLVDTIVLEVRDKLAARAYEQQSPPGANVRFDVPARMTLPDASLVVRVQARDAHGNELLTAERRVHVVRPVVAAPVPAALAPLTRTANAERPAASSGGGGFWSSPWPYIVGGTALAAGGAAFYLATRPSPDVNVGAVRVELTH